MFGGGHDDAQAAEPTVAAAPQPDGTLNGVNDLVAGTTPSAAPPTYDSDAGFLPDPSGPAQDTPAPAPATDDTPADAAVVAPTVDLPAAPSATPASAPTLDGDDDLLDIKQQALQQLTPLVGHLDQTPEEKFRTTMMMIQAADNQALLKDAYTAAQAIPDEKVRAQALLDVINEINYFTQSKPQQPPA
jgi:hypothetical protein